MSITLKRTKGHATVNVKGECTVAQAIELKDALMSAFEGARTVTLDFSDITFIDMSAFQLICAAHLTAMDVGTDIGVAPMPQVMLSTIEELGFTRHMPCSNDKSGQCMFCLVEQKKGNK